MFKFILPLLILPFACLPDDGAVAFDRERFEDGWWYSDKFEVCICFFNTNPDAEHPRQLLMFNTHTSNIEMLASWDFEDPNYYVLDPNTTPDQYGQVVFEINAPQEAADAACWDIEFRNNTIGSREVMCDCSQRKER